MLRNVQDNVCNVSIVSGWNEKRKTAITMAAEKERNREMGG